MSTAEALQLGLTFAVVGMLIVFVVLSVIGLVIAALNHWSDRLDARTATAATTATVGDTIDPQTLAVIAAAATAALKRPVRLRKIHKP